MSKKQLLDRVFTRKGQKEQILVQDIALRAEVLTTSVSGGVFRVVSSDLLDVNIP